MQRAVVEVARAHADAVVVSRSEIVVRVVVMMSCSKGRPLSVPVIVSVAIVTSALSCRRPGDCSRHMTRCEPLLGLGAAAVR